MNVLFIEPFCGGSHAQFAESVRRFSRHDIAFLSLPASFWKWRMRGAHLSLRDRVLQHSGSCDCLLVSDMLSLAELAGMVPELARLPKVVYFHENQLSYPVPKGESPDVHFGFTNLSTALAADRLVFNSNFHRDEFIGGIDAFLAAMPDHRPRRMSDELAGRTAVVYPGIDCDTLGRKRPVRGEGPPVILWNHRWEFDKGPEIFFEALTRLAGEGLAFSVRVLGENFQAQPKPFLAARELLGNRLLDFGFAERREDYVAALRQSDIVVSTARQEFYGIAVLEGVYCGCRPLLPRRLSYPELFPDEYLYEDDEDFFPALKSLVRHRVPPVPASLRRAIERDHDIRASVALLDGMIEETATGKGVV